MKISEFEYTTDDIITTDKYLNFCLDNHICYVKTDFFYTGKFMWRGKPHPEFLDDTVVIGHSDYPIIDQISERFKKILCINKYTRRENTYGMPLGITNYCDDSPIHKIYGNTEIMIEVFDDQVYKSNLCYLNFNISNYPSERQFIYNKYSNLSWVKEGSVENTLQGRKTFLRDIKSSKFVFCPRGNGIDTHRLWETLYMGSIPIVKYEISHELFHDLPILFVNSWEDITEEFLERTYNDFQERDWNLEKLRISYWYDFIKKTLYS